MAHMRKKPRWTRAMRLRAAEAGRKGDREGKRRGGQAGGLITWHTRTPDQQGAIRAMLRGSVGKRRGAGANRSAKARAAQRARGKAGVLRPSRAKALFLADLGMMRKDVIVGPLPESLPGLPVREDYPDREAWRRALDDYHRERYRAEMARAAGRGNGE